MKIIYQRFLVLLSFILILSCSSDREAADPPPPPSNPTGEYQVSLVIIEWTDEDGESFTDLATTDCDLISIIKFNSNNSLQITNYNLGNDDDCSNSELISGNWQETATISGGFSGDFTLNNAFNGGNIFNGRYRDIGQSVAAIELIFNVTVDGQTYKYEYNAIKI